MKNVGVAISRPKMPSPGGKVPSRARRMRDGEMQKIGKQSIKMAGGETQHLFILVQRGW